MLFHGQLGVQGCDLLFDGLDLWVTLSFDHAVTGAHKGQHVTVGADKAPAQLVRFSQLFIVEGLHENAKFLLLPLKKPFKLKVGMGMESGKDLFPDEEKWIILLSVLGCQLVTLKWLDIEENFFSLPFCI